jgi:uncharacterized protein (TIGR00369 family)
MDSSLPEQFSSVPINHWLGLRMVAHTASETTAVLPCRPEFAQETGVVHGAIVTLLADTAAVYLVMPDLPKDWRMASVEFKVNFLAPAFVDAGQLTAVAKLIKRGRRVAVCQSEVWQQQVQVAIGLFTYAMWPKSG